MAASHCGTKGHRLRKLEIERNNLKWSGKLESLAERVEALERLNVLRGLAKPATKQARAINLICDNLAVIQEMIEKDGTNPTGLIRLADGDA